MPAGVVARPHGLDGAFHVARAVPGLLTVGALLAVGSHPRRVVRRAGTDARPIIALEGIADREAASALAGAELLADPADAPALQPDEYWAHELVGCAVGDGARAVGEVTGLLALPSCEVLEVARSEGAQLLVPLVGDAVRSVDVDARHIDVDLRFLGES